MIYVKNSDLDATKSAAFDLTTEFYFFSFDRTNPSIFGASIHVRRHLDLLSDCTLIDFVIDRP